MTATQKQTEAIWRAALCGLHNDADLISDETGIPVDTVREVLAKRGTPSHVLSNDGWKITESAPVDFEEDDSDYGALRAVLDLAYAQAAHGKGRERHANGLPFTDQPIFAIADMVGDGFLSGQAIKKIQEAQRMDSAAAQREILGAIVYLAALHIRIGSET